MTMKREPIGGDTERPQATPSETVIRPDSDRDLIEWYYEKGWTDGLPVVPPTAQKVAAMGCGSWRQCGAH